MTQGENQASAERGAGIEILSTPAELDVATGNDPVQQGYAAIDRSARVLLLDLADLSFCDARGLSAFVQIANHADTAGCRFALFVPQPLVAKILRISGLDRRMPVLAPSTTHCGSSQLQAALKRRNSSQLQATLKRRKLRASPADVARVNG